ncbi:hypothetical protein O2W14_04585 [Modestobacter sp. VKM Ac-2986]|uniref:hypothetical protein n=1 Tax=Modestobacter sp. VKM Ac-2986 TaxID=3004140 RepID=UPI0022AA776A|nr:hypothetical protein [Modestobacter sp. VKM Ac-2986]MCZ2828111.1 hypothetical protein [Modestobacter sp. VKM Ac-2986]
MSDRVQRWELSALGRRHRVETTGSVLRTVTWHVDDRLVATTRSSDDTIRLTPGDRLEKSQEEGAGEPPPDVGALSVTFTALGRPKRATWYRPDGDVAAPARALLGVGGVDLAPEPGSPAALREERIERHPRRHTALAVAGGVATVVLPLLLGLLVVRLAIAIPWPDWDLPDIPWPDLDLPSIPWPDVDLPDVDLPDWPLPGWVTWLLDRAGYVWPVVVAWFLARREVRRRREQSRLRAELAADARAGAPDRADPDPGPGTSPPPPAEDGPRTHDRSPEEPV